MFVQANATKCIRVKKSETWQHEQQEQTRYRLTCECTHLTAVYPTGRQQRITLSDMVAVINDEWTTALLTNDAWSQRREPALTNKHSIHYWPPSTPPLFFSLLFLFIFLHFLAEVQWKWIPRHFTCRKMTWYNFN